MLNLKKGTLLLVFLFLSTTCFAVGEDFGPSVENGNIYQTAARKRAKKKKEFRLSDFSGKWTFKATSAGGVSGSNATGTSFVLDGQANFNDEGHGKINFASGAIYTGTVGQVIPITLSGNASVKLTITDSVNGIGSLIIRDPSLGFIETVDFVASKSSKDGMANRMEGHRTTVNSTTTGVGTYTFRRQFQ